MEAGFATDATLLSDVDFRVNASHRAGPGEAEVHVKDTDIFYVLKGHAELIVGGDGQSIRMPCLPGRFADRGSTEARCSNIAQGDVVTIPRGVPHWFKQVSTPFTYYVIKSTHNG